MHPLLMLVVLLGTLYARTKLHRRDRQEKLHQLHWLQVPWALVLQPYTFFLSAFSIYYLYLLGCYFSLMSEYSWLDPDTFHRPPTTDKSQADALEAFAIPSGITGLCKTAPFFIGATFAITVVHLWQHLPKRPTSYGEHFRWFPTFSHDLAMQVAALPLVYGIFALDNVIQELRIFTGGAYIEFSPGKRPGHEFETWTKSVFVTQQSYDTNFELADLYEAWALRCFGLLCFALVRRQVLLEAPTVKYLIDTVKHHLTSVATEDSHDVAVLRDLTLLENPQKMLFQPLQQTSRLGVMVFVYTYAAKSAYSLALTFLALPPLNMQLCGDGGAFPAACSLRPYAEGAAMLASTLAILNIVVFESSLKIILKRSDFRPFMKFLAVKVLVSISFFQYYVLEALLGYAVGLSEQQISLCYASLICCEVLPLSVIVFISWRPHEGDWHDGDLHGGEGEGDSTARVELADDECGNHMTTDSFVRSRQPSAVMASRAPLPYELTAILELRGDCNPQDGRALENLVHALSAGRFRAEYKPAALYRDHAAALPRYRSSDLSSSMLSAS